MPYDIYNYCIKALTMYTEENGTSKNITAMLIVSHIKCNDEIAWPDISQNFVCCSKISHTVNEKK